MRKRAVCFIYIVISLLLAWPTVYSQPKPEYTSKNKKAISAFEKGLKNYEFKNDDEALKDLKKAVSIDENFLEAYNLMGSIYYDRNDFENSIMNFKKTIEINPGYHPNIYYHLAQSELKAAKYADAAGHFTIFLGKEKINKELQQRAARMLKNAEFGARAVKNPVPFNPQNLGREVNSSLSEYSPSVSIDELSLIFTRKIPKQGSFENVDEDFFISGKDEKNSWSKAEPMGPPINTVYREGAKSLSPDGRILYFTVCDRPDGKGSCDIYFSNLVGSKWGPPQNMGFPVNSGKWDSQPSISSDGKTLYFTSARAGGKGGKDIWMSQMNDQGSWSNPVSLELNTEGDDEAPYIHPDNQTFYFSSDFYPGLGGMDLFIVRRDSAGNFSKPQNLGYPINTFADEYTIFVSSSGETAYYASDRKDGLGGFDIYSFEMPQEIRPMKVTYAKGSVYDAVSGKKLEAKFELIDLESRQVAVQSYSSSDNGKFLVTLPVNKNYALNVSKEGYLFYSENYSLKERKDFKPYILEVPLQPIEIGSRVILKNIFFETAKFDLKDESKAELNRLVSFLKSNPKIKIEISGHTDNVGSKEYNQTLSENRAKAVNAYLLMQGITAPRLSYKGYGDTQPLCPANDTDECRAENRRTEFKVIGK